MMVKTDQVQANYHSKTRMGEVLFVYSEAITLKL